MYKEDIKSIKNHIDKGRWWLNEAANDENSEDVKNKLLYADNEFITVIQNVRELRKKTDESDENEISDMLNSSASGTIELVGNYWLHLRLEMTLPGDRNRGEVKRVSNTVNNLLDYYYGYLGYLPRYEWAFVAIVEHKTPDGNDSSYDNDNKGYRAIPNALKGRVFADDNQFNMSLGLFTIDDSEAPCCDVYVVPMDEVADFAAQFLVF